MSTAQPTHADLAIRLMTVESTVDDVDKRLMTVESSVEARGLQLVVIRRLTVAAIVASVGSSGPDSWMGHLWTLFTAAAGL